MNKILLFSKRFPIDYVSGDIIDKSPDVAEPNKQLLDYIFGKDPVSGHPSGDLSVYLGEKSNPEVKAFIQTNLMQPLIDDKGGLNLSSDELNKIRGTITDDDIAQFSRNHDETREEYADRIRLYLSKEKYERSQKSLEIQRKKLYEEALKSVRN